MHVTFYSFHQREVNVNNFSATFNSRLQRLKTEGFLHSNNVKLIQSQHNCPFDYTAYPRFYSLISSPGNAVKPRSRPINWVMKWIEALYENRFDFIFIFTCLYRILPNEMEKFNLASY